MAKAKLDQTAWWSGFFDAIKAIYRDIPYPEGSEDALKYLDGRMVGEAQRIQL